MNDHECHHLLGALSDYVDGTAPEAICREIERHLDGCENCRVVVDTLGQTVKLYQELPRPELPAALRRRLFRTFAIEDLLSDPPDPTTPEF